MSNYPKEVFKRLKALPKITSMFPLLYRMDESTILAKDGSYIALLELEGLDYTGMQNEQFNLLFNIRKRLFEKDSAFYRLDIISRKTRTSAKDKIDIDSNNQILVMMKKAWRNNFDVLYRTKHYLAISVNKGGLMSKVGGMVNSDYNINRKEELSRLIDEISSELQDYSPRLLKNHELSSFYATQLNGRDTHLNAAHWDQPLSNQPVQFDASKNYCTYGKHGDTLFSGWLSISRYSEEISKDTLERIFKLPYRFNIYQSFKSYQKSHAMNRFEAVAKELKNWGGENDYFVDQLVEFSDKVAADKVRLLRHSFCIEVIAETEQELNQNVRAIINSIESDGQTTLYRETRNIEALFWSRFPTMQDFNSRGRDLSSENASHLASFNKVGEGFDTCGFGDRPVTLFKTEEGGQYSFTFHQSGEQKPDILGHTAVIGGTGSGKSTLISFLIANCLSYHDFKAICFDRLSGLKVFTEMFDGDYLDLPTEVELNPFQMADTEPNRMFLFSWLKRLGRIDENDNKYNSVLHDLINTNFSLEKSQRSFENLAVALGVEGGELYNRFEQWLPNKSRGQFFNGKRDSLSFEKDIVTFDATYILDQPEILPDITDYLFHQIRSKVSESVVPHIVLFDESPRYLQDEIFAKRMLEALNEERKKAGVVLLAAQKVEQFYKLPKGVGRELIGALAHIICYPEPSATKEMYVDFLGLNESEFEWVKNASPNSRKILVKNRSTDSSVILDVDLSSLRTKNYNLLNCFNSSSNAVLKLKSLKREDPTNWKYKYLRD